MRKFKVTVNGSEYEVLVEEIAEEDTPSEQTANNSSKNEDKRK